MLGVRRGGWGRAWRSTQESDESAQEGHGLTHEAFCYNWRWTLEPDCLGSNPSSGTYQSCHFGQVTTPLCASQVSDMRRGHK